MFWLFPPRFFSPPTFCTSWHPLVQVFYLWVNPCAHTCPHQSAGDFLSPSLWLGESWSCVKRTPSLSWKNFRKPPGSGMGPGWPFFRGLWGTWKKPSLPLVAKPSECSSEGGVWVQWALWARLAPSLCLPVGRCRARSSQRVLSEWVMTLLGVFGWCHACHRSQGSHSETVIFSWRISPSIPVYSGTRSEYSIPILCGFSSFYYL